MCFDTPDLPAPKTILKEPSPQRVASSQDRERRLRIARGAAASTILTTPLGLVGSAAG